MTTQPRPRVISYIDGFNLYNGLREKHARRYLWLDLEALSAALLKPCQDLAAVKCFTAMVRNQPTSLSRQQTYHAALRATTATEMHVGRFQEKSTRCRSCKTVWRTYEEKETDVSIAVGMVEDAAMDRFDTALIISADSDLCPAVRSVRRLRPNARLIAAFPPRRNSGELKKLCNAAFQIGEANIRASLLPNVVSLPDGRELHRPASWA